MCICIDMCLLQLYKDLLYTVIAYELFQDLIEWTVSTYALSNP
jgi:hypothetical protein